MFGDNLFGDWMDAVQKLQDSVDKSIYEIHAAKAEMQDLRNDVYEMLAEGQYIRDNRRLILSAPEVIIGNVDKTGEIISDGNSSVVVVRGNRVSLQGTTPEGDDLGYMGTVETLAPRIINSAVDPGIDGNEGAVMPVSQVITQARNIVLHSSDGDGVFNTSADEGFSGSVLIHADSNVIVDASISAQSISDDIDKNVKIIQKSQSDAMSAATKAKNEAQKHISAIQDAFTAQSLLLADETSTRTAVSQLDDLNDKYQEESKAFYLAMRTYIDAVSKYVELGRQMKAYKQAKDDVSQLKDDLKDGPDGTKILLRSESVIMETSDSDGVLRQNSNSGVFVRTKTFDVVSRDEKGASVKGGRVGLMAEHVAISTNDAKRKDEKKSADFDDISAGYLTIASKNVTIVAADNEVSGGEVKEKSLAKNGSITLRAENMNLCAVDTQGKAQGTISLNAKDVALKAMDQTLQDDKPADDASLAAGGKVFVGGETVIVGSKSKDIKSQTVQIAGDKAGIFADTTAEMQQGEAKAVITLDGGKATLGSSENAIEGKLGVNGEAEIKGELKTPKLTADNVEAGKSFKSTNISDGVPAPPSPPSPKVEAKLKMQEEKK